MKNLCQKDMRKHNIQAHVEMLTVITAQMAFLALPLKKGM